MDLTLIAVMVSAVLTAALALAVLFKGTRSVSNAALIAGLGLLALEAVGVGLALGASDLKQTGAWLRRSLIVKACLPGPWLIFSLTYARGNYQIFLQRWRWFVAGVTAGLVGLCVVWSDSLLDEVAMGSPSLDILFRLRWAGFVLHLIYLVCTVLILMNLEFTFRAAVGTMRWRIKFMVLGLGLLFGFRFYSNSQTLLYHAIRPSLSASSALVLGIACLLITISLFRARFGSVDIYPSQAILRGSLTILLAGMYLIVIGALAKLVVLLGGDTSFPVKAFVLLIILVGLGLLLLSDRVHHRVRLFVMRHFRRPLYDYRQVWSAFTARTVLSMDRTEYCRAVARLLSETFSALSVAVWVVDMQKGELVLLTSTLLSEAEAKQLVPSKGVQAELMRPLREHPEPFDLDACADDWVADLRRCNPDFFAKGGDRLGVPLVAGGELQGLITLADRVSGLRFSLADLDLVKCIGDQVAAGLRSIQLSEQIVRSKEMETFQTMSTFLVHDLKNMGSTLSLMLQNMSEHFDDPAFRTDAMRGLSRSVAHLNDVVARFNQLRQGMRIVRVETDLNAVISDALVTLNGLGNTALSKELAELPRMRLDAEQMQRVITNLVLNARDAMAGRPGQISIRTGQRKGWAFLSVADSGAGMTQEFVARSLFKPFQTTKKNGLGIGMFQSKMIVEAHGGRIEVQSEPGHGTVFQVCLPLETATV